MSRLILPVIWDEVSGPWVTPTLVLSAKGSPFCRIAEVCMWLGRNSMHEAKIGFLKSEHASVADAKAWVEATIGVVEEEPVAPSRTAAPP